MHPISEAQKVAGKFILVRVNGQLRRAGWGKTSHMPWEGWCFADQGAENFDLILPEPTEFLPDISLRLLRAAGKERLPAGERGTLRVHFASDMKESVENLPNFTGVEKYAAATPVAGEIGMVELFRFVEMPSLAPGEWTMELEQAA